MRTTELDNFFQPNSILSFAGRDTPSSQIMENENEEPSANEPAVPPASATTGKQPRFDLDDKFGKFEIKSLPRGKYI